MTETEAANRAPVRDLLASEIDWSLPSVPAPAPMSGAELLTEAIIDGLAYRLVLVECFDALRQVTIQRDRARAECIRLREVMRG